MQLECVKTEFQRGLHRDFRNKWVAGGSEALRSLLPRWPWLVQTWYARFMQDTLWVTMFTNVSSKVTERWPRFQKARAPCSTRQPSFRTGCTQFLQRAMENSVLFNLTGSAARYPPGPRLGKPLPPPLALQNVGVVGRRIYHFSSSSMRVLARGMDANGGGRRPLQIASSFAIRFHSRCWR